MRKFFLDKNWLMVGYALMAILLAVVIFTAKNIVLNPWSITLVFLGILLIPGFSLARIFKINFENDKLGQVILWLALGLIFSLLISFIAMFAGISILVLNRTYPFILAVLLVLAAFLDLSRPMAASEHICHLEWKKILTFENLLSLFLLLFGIVGIIAIVFKGSLFRGGDPNYHLSILRKAFDGAPLTPANLSFIKSETSHIAYGLPVWHVFLALIARFHLTEPFILWKTISIPLSIFSMLVWYWLALKVFNNRFFASLALIFFLLHIFNLNSGYYFTCLPLPDTLNTFLIFPLAISLCLKYIFDKTTDYKLLLTTAILVIFMAVIHLTQYFYFLMALVSLTLVWLIFQWKNPDFKDILKRIFWVFAASFLIFLPLVGLLELKSHIISHTFKTMLATNDPRGLRYALFIDWDIFFKYSYLAAPLVLLFVKKQPRLSFLFGLLLITPIAYIKPVSVILVKFLDYILVNRLLGSITWNYFVFALIFGFLVILVDRLITKLSFSKFSKIASNILLILATALFVQLQFIQGLGEFLYIKVFSDATDLLLDQYHFWILGIIIAITAIILIIGYFRPKVSDFFELTTIKHSLVPVCLIIALMTIFISSTYGTHWGYVVAVQERKLATAPSEMAKFEKDTISGMGGQEMINFVKANISPDSVFMAPGSAIQTMPMVVDQFMAAYPHTAKSDRLSELYDEIYTPEQKLGLVKEFEIQYIVLYRPANQGEKYFDSYPQYYEKVFNNNESSIYKVWPQAYIDAKIDKSN